MAHFTDLLYVNQTRGMRRNIHVHAYLLVSLFSNFFLSQE